MILTRISEHYDLTFAEQMKEYFVKQGKQNVRIHYNQRTDKFDVIYDVTVKEKIRSVYE